MTSLRPSRRKALPVLLAVAVVSSLGCEDDRGNPLGPDPGPLDADVLFGSSLVSAEVFRMINFFAVRALDLYEGGGSLPVTEPACLPGAGTARITDLGDANPATFGVTFTNYVVACEAMPLTVNSDAAVGGRMAITLVETSPGLVFEVSLPILPAPRFPGDVYFVPAGFTIQLPAEQGSLILAVTTPDGPLRFALDGPRAGLRHEGFVHVEGTVRLEDRLQPLVIVEELALEYAYDDDLLTKLADWPSGSYEIAGFGGGSGGGFGGATPGYPVEVFFDGLGGVAFPVDERTCFGNMVTGENPCEDL
jgi:hypothetical protein